MISEITAFKDVKNNLYSEKYLSKKTFEKHTKVIEVSRAMRAGGAVGSKGNQRKWKLNDFFIKMNCLGYEDLAEVLTCWVLQRVKNLKFPYVKYYPCKIIENGITLGTGCYSENFLKDAEEVTFGKILEDNLLPFSIKYDELRDLIYDEADLDCKDYLDTILCLDAITRNEDRHFGNIALNLRGEKFSFSPIFDNGDSFLSDTIDYPMNADFEMCFWQLQAKPFSCDYNNQIGTVQRLLIDRNSLLDSIDPSGWPELERAKKVLEYALEDSKNIAWEEY